MTPETIEVSDIEYMGAAKRELAAALFEMPDQSHCQTTVLSDEAMKAFARIFLPPVGRYNSDHVADFHAEDAVVDDLVEGYLRHEQNDQGELHLGGLNVGADDFTIGVPEAAEGPALMFSTTQTVTDVKDVNPVMAVTFAGDPDFVQPEDPAPEDSTKIRLDLPQIDPIKASLSDNKTTTSIIDDSAIDILKNSDPDPAKPNRLGRKLARIGAAALIAVGVVGGVFAQKLFPKRQSTDETSLAANSATTIASPTTINKTSTTIYPSKAPGAVAIVRRQEVPQHQTPEFNPPNNSGSLIVSIEDPGESVFNLVQNQVAGESGQRADKDPMVKKFTDEVLAIIAEQNKAKTGKYRDLNTVYKGEQFTAQLTPELIKIKDEINNRYKMIHGQVDLASVTIGNNG